MPRLVMAITFVLLFAMAARLPVETDLWWHLRAGDWVWAGKGFIYGDPFSFTKAGAPWINHSWGAQQIMTALYNGFGGYLRGGDGALGVWMALTAVAGLWFANRCVLEGHVFARAFLLILAGVTASVYWSPRPQMFSYLFSAILLYVLHLYRRKNIDRLWLLLPLMALWANLHGGFSIGFILLFVFIAGEIVGRFFAPQEGLSWRQIGKVALVTLGCVFALLLNPNGALIWRVPFETFGIGVLQQYIREWASPDFHMVSVWPFAFMILGTVALLGLSDMRLAWYEIALFCGTAFLALYSGRNISIFALVATPIVIQAFTAWLHSMGLRERKPIRPRGATLILNYALLLTIAGGVGLFAMVNLSPISLRKTYEESMPVKAAEVLNKANLSGNMFNSYNWGGFLVYFAPNYPVFVDGRTDLYGDVLLREWLNTASGINWRETFQKWQIQIVVIEPDSALANILRTEPGWQLLHEDALLTIFVKQGV
jgi:hypothetical protein